MSEDYVKLKVLNDFSPTLKLLPFRILFIDAVVLLCKLDQ